MYADIVESILSKSGWSRDRKVSTTQWVKQLESEGFTFIPEAIEVLENFGGLEVQPIKNQLDTFLKGVLRFDPFLAASGEFDRVEYWQKRLQLKLSPLAEGSKGESLLLGDDQRVYSCYGPILYLEGASFEDALENTLIVARRKSVEVGRMADDA